MGMTTKDKQKLDQFCAANHMSYSYDFDPKLRVVKFRFSKMMVDGNMANVTLEYFIDHSTYCVARIIEHVKYHYTKYIPEVSLYG